MELRLESDLDPLAPHSLSASELKLLLEAEQTGEPFVAYKNEDGKLALFWPGTESPTRSLGRRSESDLAITWDGEVSGLHAELERLSGEWTIVDDGLSTNGTFLNGRRISGRQRLRDGDRVRVGHTVLVYRSAQPADPASTVAASSLPMVQSLTDTQHRVLVALCRPLRDGDFAAIPATNQQISEEVFLSVDAVKMHLRTLYAKFELGELPQNEKRARLAASVLQLGVVSPRELQ